MVFWNKRKEQEDKDTFYAKIFWVIFVIVIALTIGYCSI